MGFNKFLYSSTISALYTHLIRVGDLFRTDERIYTRTRTTPATRFPPISLHEHVFNRLPNFLPNYNSIVGNFTRFLNVGNYKKNEYWKLYRTLKVSLILVFAFYLLQRSRDKLWTKWRKSPTAGSHTCLYWRW